MTTELFVHFDDTDLGGIVFFGNYYRISSRLVEEFLVKRGIQWEEWFGGKNWLVPIRHSEADYLKPLWPGKKYSAAVKILKVGESSVRFEVRIGPAEAPRAYIRTTHVFVDPKTHQKMAIPDSIRQRL